MLVLDAAVQGVEGLPEGPGSLTHQAVRLVEFGLQEGHLALQHGCLAGSQPQEELTAGPALGSGV